ncbi:MULTISPECIES: hypothetical protein [Aerosakkonema]|uniref:hypothetical protein n=1 Tax=Aerosakkonema TaxID=1246629 RepID=UPI0035B6E16E
MAKIEDWGVTVDEYLEGLAQGIDILEVKRLEARGIPHHLALEVIEIEKKVIGGTATDEDIVRGLMIITPSLRSQLIAKEQIEADAKASLSNEEAVSG